jgi:DNA-directed RNA polymerase subunit M/transcription elongation factor TFIIS
MDTYNTTSTAATERTCPICKNLLLENSKGNYYCLQCGYMECLSVNPHPQEDIKRMFEDLDKIDEYKKQSQSKEKQETPNLYGWICPKCGAVMSPFQSFCLNCSNSNWELTCADSNTVSTSQNAQLEINKTTKSFDVYQFIGGRKDKYGYE